MFIYRQRIGYELLQRENLRMDEFCTKWFRDRETPGSGDFWRELDDLSWTFVRKWQAKDIHKWSIEDEDPEKIISEGMFAVDSEIKAWSEEYWRNHEKCHQISEERFVEETAKRWNYQLGGRIHGEVENYQKQWTDRRQHIMMERLEEMNKCRSIGVQTYVGKTCYR
jgi:hypothetical protein